MTDGREFFREGIVKEIDRRGTADGNINGIAPAAEVLVLEGETYDSHWIRVGSMKFGKRGKFYIPLDIYDRVLIACPGGYLDQAVIIACLEGVPEAAGTTDEERAERAVFEWGGLLFVMDRTDGKEQVTISTPNGHRFVLRDEVNSQGIVLQTGDGHLLAMADLDPESRLTLKHKGGTEIVMDENGDWRATVIRDENSTIQRNRTVDIAGNNSEIIGGNDTREVADSITYTAENITIEARAVVNLKGGQLVNVFTDAATLAGVHTALTDPVCCVTGIPRGATMTTRMGA